MDNNLKNRGIKYIILSILEIIFCWRIVGVVALILSIIAMVNASNGDEEGALNMFKWAKVALWVSFGFALVMILLMLLGVGLIGLGADIISNYAIIF